MTPTDHLKDIALYISRELNTFFGFSIDSDSIFLMLYKSFYQSSGWAYSSTHNLDDILSEFTIGLLKTDLPSIKRNFGSQPESMIYPYLKTAIHHRFNNSSTSVYKEAKKSTLFESDELFDSVPNNHHFKVERVDDEFVSMMKGLISINRERMERAKSNRQRNKYERLIESIEIELDNYLNPKAHSVFSIEQSSFEQELQDEKFINQFREYVRLNSKSKVRVEILNLFLEGYNAVEISKKVGISDVSIGNHLRRLEAMALKFNEEFAI